MHSSSAPAWGPSHGPQSFVKLLRRGSSLPRGAVPLEQLSQRALHGPQPPSGLHLLRRGVLHGLQVDLCPSVDLHGLQGDNLLHHGRHHELQRNLGQEPHYSSPSFFTDLGVCSRSSQQAGRRLSGSFLHLIHFNCSSPLLAARPGRVGPSRLPGGRPEGEACKAHKARASPSLPPAQLLHISPFFFFCFPLLKYVIAEALSQNILLPIGSALASSGSALGPAKSTEQRGATSSSFLQKLPP